MTGEGEGVRPAWGTPSAPALCPTGPPGSLRSRGLRDAAGPWAEPEVLSFSPPLYTPPPPSPTVPRSPTRAARTPARGAAAAAPMPSSGERLQSATGAGGGGKLPPPSPRHAALPPAREQSVSTPPHRAEPARRAQRLKPCLGPGREGRSWARVGRHEGRGEKRDLRHGTSCALA
ncbi:nascent polypeptide-associated complex subunit alpha, muscle-specific form-like [Dromiciops gliroides]|uniref:nascent polypeptide-associated complex subunit alpha, muscle-specific form-like n=1 Tax=Dromiciops gliroides TaxID=33562 RepID=UPI001CC637AF|nr:nascent polypeptide-associated complex subunit alpha, muscle-specific form-like [Dromiciops gliroides]